jgi:hypothetical protein
VRKNSQKDLVTSEEVLTFALAFGKEHLLRVKRDSGAGLLKN